MITVWNSHIVFRVDHDQMEILFFAKKLNCNTGSWRKQGNSKVKLLINYLNVLQYIAHITKGMCVGEALGDVSVPLVVRRGEDEEIEVGGTHCGW